MKINEPQSQSLRSLITAKAKADAQTEKLATGKRVNRASDDAAAMSIIESMTSEIKGLAQSHDNVASGMAALETTEGAASEITNLLQRQKELAIQSSNGTMSNSDRAALNEEFTSLTEQINDISNKTTYNGQSLLNGEGLGSGSAKLKTGEGEEMTLSKADMRTQSLGTSSSDISTQAGAADAIDSIQSAIDQSVSLRAKKGAEYSRLQSASSNIENQLVQQQDARSKMQDTDYATTITELQKTKVQSKAAMKTLSAENETLRSVLEMLKR